MPSVIIRWYTAIKERYTTGHTIQYTISKHQKTISWVSQIKDIIGSIDSNVFQDNGKKFNNTGKYDQPILKKAKNNMDVKSGQDYLSYEEVGKIGPLTEVLEDMLIKLSSRHKEERFRNNAKLCFGIARSNTELS
jgi:hypothetical protein